MVNYIDKWLLIIKIIHAGDQWLMNIGSCLTMVKNWIGMINMWWWLIMINDGRFTLKADYGWSKVDDPEVNQPPSGLSWIPYYLQANIRVVCHVICMGMGHCINPRHGLINILIKTMLSGHWWDVNSQGYRDHPRPYWISHQWCIPTTSAGSLHPIVTNLLLRMFSH